MLNHLKNSVYQHVYDNKMQYLLLVFFIVVGITAGTYTISRMQGTVKTALSGYAGAVFICIRTTFVDYWRVFFSAFFINILYFAILAWLSMMTVGIGCVSLVMILKGFCVGFSAGILSLDFVFGGLGAVLACVFLPNLLLLPCLLKAGVLSMNNAIKVFKNRRIPSTSRDRLLDSRLHFKKLFFVFLVSLLGVLMQTLISPALMRV